MEDWGIDLSPCNSATARFLRGQLLRGKFPQRGFCTSCPQKHPHPGIRVLQGWHRGGAQFHFMFAVFRPVFVQQNEPFPVNNKAFSSKRGLFFTVKGLRAIPKFHTDPPPRPPFGRPPTGIFSKHPCGEGPGGGGLFVWSLGSARGPFTVKKRLLFVENALLFKAQLLRGKFPQRGFCTSCPRKDPHQA